MAFFFLTIPFAVVGCYILLDLYNQKSWIHSPKGLFRAIPNKAKENHLALFSCISIAILLFAAGLMEFSKMNYSTTIWCFIGSFFIAVVTVFFLRKRAGWPLKRWL